MQYCQTPARAFTLIELIIALSIMTLIITPLVSAFPQHVSLFTARADANILQALLHQAHLQARYGVCPLIPCSKVPNATITLTLAGVDQFPQDNVLPIPLTITPVATQSVPIIFFPGNGFVSPISIPLHTNTNEPWCLTFSGEELPIVQKKVCAASR